MGRVTFSIAFRKFSSLFLSSENRNENKSSKTNVVIHIVITLSEKSLSFSLLTS